jgi:hypothetical protein
VARWYLGVLFPGPPIPCLPQQSFNLAFIDPVAKTNGVVTSWIVNQIADAIAHGPAPKSRILNSLAALMPDIAVMFDSSLREAPKRTNKKKHGQFHRADSMYL